MKNLNEKYYDGFEGEPEIIFRLEKETDEKIEIGIWDGYFNQIMEQIELKDGMWTSLAYHYHLCIGWYDESPWLIENLLEAYEQLSEINKSNLEFQESQEVLDIILNILKEAIINNYKVFISYE